MTSENKIKPRGTIADFLRNTQNVGYTTGTGQKVRGAVEQARDQQIQDQQRSERVQSGYITRNGRRVRGTGG